MLETVDRLAQVTHTRLSAQPNAGKPRDIEGRNIYLSSPEYMASYARRFVTRGVRLVGGCCGTTPEHIRQIKSAVKSLAPGLARAAAARVASSEASRVTVAEPAPQPAVSREEKSELANALASGRFATVVSLVPPTGYSSDEPIRRSRDLKIRGVDVIAVPDARGARLSALSLAVLIQQHAGIETMLQYSCRDRNLLGMQSDLLGAHAMGVRNLLIITGDARSVGDYPDATAVFDVDSIGLTNVVSRLNSGLDVGGQPIGVPTAFHVGVMVNPGAENLDAEMRRFEYKVEAGAEFAVTRPVFDVAGFERFVARIERARLPLLVGLWPFESVLNAEFMANEVPGVTVPDAVIDRMRRAENADAAAAEGIAIARELGRAVKGLVQGVHVSAPSSRIEAVLGVLEGIR
jgi:homocysteine S-methyltransferase